MSKNLTPAEKSLRGSVGGHTSWANTLDWSARTKPGRDAAFQRFEDEIERQFPGLESAERRKRALHLQRAHMKRLALKSAQTRRLKKAS